MAFSSLEMQKRPIQTTSFLLCLKRKHSQTFKSRSCKKSFLQCACYWYNLRQCFSFYVMTERHYICESLLLIICFFKCYDVAFFDTNVLKVVHILLYLHKNITHTIFQNKTVLNYAS